MHLIIFYETFDRIIRTSQYDQLKSKLMLNVMIY